MIFNRPESHRMLRQRILFSMCVWFASVSCRRLVEPNFSYSLGFGQAAYSGSAGESVQIDIYIRELVTNGSIPRFAVGNNDGLFSIGATINYSADFGVPAAIESSSDIVFAPSFDGVDVVATPSQNKLELTSFLTRRHYRTRNDGRSDQSQYVFDSDRNSDLQDESKRLAIRRPFRLASVCWQALVRSTTTWHSN